jgi:hypothetical protein
MKRVIELPKGMSFPSGSTAKSRERAVAVLMGLGFSKDRAEKVVRSPSKP